MAFDFLGSIGDIANTVTQVASPIQQIIGAIKGPSKYGNLYAPKEYQALQQQLQNIPAPESEKYAISLIKALQDPQSSYVKEQEQADYRDLVDAFRSQLRSETLAGRRERSLGTATGGTERRDETLAYLTSRGLPKLQSLARENAVNRIMKAITGSSQFAGAQSARHMMGLGSQYSDYMHRANVYENQPQQLTGAMGRVQTGLEGLGKILETINRPTAPIPQVPVYPQRKPYIPGISPYQDIGGGQRINWSTY